MGKVEAVAKEIGPTDLAKVLGVSVRTIHNARNRGRIKEIKKGVYDLDQARRDFESSRGVKRGSGHKRGDRREKPGPKPKEKEDAPIPPPDPDRPTVADAQAAKLMAEGLTARLKYRQLVGELVSTQDVNDRFFTWARIWRNGWSNWPARIGGELAAELQVDPRFLIQTLERYVREHLAELAEERPPTFE